MELTIGQQRTIQESTMAWSMYLSTVEDAMSEVPKSVRAKIRALEEEYIEAFGEYYTQSIEAGDGRYDNEVEADFVRKWAAEHPEFFDVRTLYAECGEDVLKEAEQAIRNVESTFQQIVGLKK